MSTINDFINRLAIKAGVAADNAALKDVLTNAELAKISLPHELESALDAGLHSLDSAKGQLRNVLKAEILNGVDAELDSFVNENEFEEAVATEIKAEKSTGKRLRLIAQKIKDLEATKGKAAQGDKAEIQKTINDLKTSLAAQTQAHANEIARLNSEKENELTGYLIRNTLGQYNYGIPIDDSDIKVDIALTTLNKQLATKGAKLIRTNGNLEIKSADGTDYFDKSSNLKINAKDFIEGAIAPILKKSEGAQSTNDGTQQTQYKAADGFIPNESAIEKIEAQIKEFQKA